jgi:uncharacterized protein (TIGR00251 family)
LTEPFSATAAGVRVALRAAPRAKRERIEGIEPDGKGGVRLRVAVTAPPVDGAANEAIIRLLAKAWDVPRGSIAVTAGGSGRDKLILVSGDPAVLLPRLRAWSEELP